MKKKKLNNGGFVLVETLIVTVFVMSIFSILYNNFYPLMGEYEKREVYDEVDAKYATYWIKRLIEDPQVTFTTNNLNALDASNANAAGYFTFDCGYLSASAEKQKTCERILSASQVRTSRENKLVNGTYKDVDVPHIYITTYNLADFKEKIDTLSNNMSGGMHRYVDYLPEYTIGSMNGAKYRVIVEFYRTRDDNDYLAYSTFEVKK